MGKCVTVYSYISNSEMSQGSPAVRRQSFRLQTVAPPKPALYQDDQAGGVINHSDESQVKCAAV